MMLMGLWESRCCWGEYGDLILCFIMRELGEEDVGERGSPSHIRPTCNLIENGDILCIWAQPHGHRLRRTE